jgi:hypothetical protein
MHARREYGRSDLCADIVQGFGEDAYRVAWGRGIGVLKRDREDDALAGKDAIALTTLPSIKEPLDPKETIRSS